MLVQYDIRNYQKFATTNKTDTSFPSKVATTTAPSNDGVITFPATAGGVGGVPSRIMIIPYGTGDDDDVFDMRIIGWRLVGTLYVPTILAQLTCTMSTAVGVSGATVSNTERFADTITLAAAYSSTQNVVTSPTGNVIAHVTMQTKGFSILEATFDMTTGDPTNANCLWAPY